MAFKKNECSYCKKPDPKKTCLQCKEAYYCSADCQKAHWKLIHKIQCYKIASVQKHSIQKTDSLVKIQSVIDAAEVNDVIELPSGTFQGGEGGDNTDCLIIRKNLHIMGADMESTIMNCNLTIKQDDCSGGKIVLRDLTINGHVSITENAYKDITLLSVKVHTGPNDNALTVSTCKGNFFLYCCEIIGGSDGLCLLDCSTEATINETDISCARSRGIFANKNFKIKDSAVYNCGSYGIKGRSGWTDLGGNMLQPGPWSEFGGPYQQIINNLHSNYVKP